jgi:hypothetical protein
MNLARYQKLPADLRTIIDDTTGLGLSLRAAANIQKHSDDAVAAARRDKEVIALSADEQRRWTAAFAPTIRAQLAATEKPGGTRFFSPMPSWLLPEGVHPPCKPPRPGQILSLLPDGRSRLVGFVTTGFCFAQPGETDANWMFF